MKSKLNILLSTALISTAFFAIFVFATISNHTKNIYFKNTIIRAEIADTALKIEKGLMFRKNIANNSGMLFVFKEEGRYAFWMKNMRFPLDIIWISKDRKVIGIAQDNVPCKGNCLIKKPLEKAKYVLEVNSGFVRKHGINLGDEVFFKQE